MDAKPLALQEEEGAVSQGMPLEAGKSQGTVFPLQPPEETRPDTHLCLSPLKVFQISHLQNCKRVNLCCLKLLSVQ